MHAEFVNLSFILFATTLIIYKNIFNTDFHITNKNQLTQLFFVLYWRCCEMPHILLPDIHCKLMDFRLHIMEISTMTAEISSATILGLIGREYLALIKSWWSCMHCHACSNICLDFSITVYLYLYWSNDITWTVHPCSVIPDWWMRVLHIRQISHNFKSYKFTSSQTLNDFSALVVEQITLWISPYSLYTLQWRHNEHDGVSDHQHHDCLLNRLSRRSSKKTPKLRVTGLCVGNSPMTGEFPAQRASNADDVSIWWRHHETYALHVFQIGCTKKTAYALTDGVLYVMGYNYDGSAGLGPHKRVIREPTAITIDGNR